MFSAPAPHLDYYQDDAARLEFHETFPLIDPEHSERNVSEAGGIFCIKMILIEKYFEPTKLSLN